MDKEGLVVSGFVRWFSELKRDNIDIAGEKGVSLAELNRTGKFNIPVGFVLTSAAFDYFLERNSLKSRIRDIIDRTNFSNESDIKNSSKRISDLIESANFPEDIKENLFEAYEILDVDRKGPDTANVDALNILINSHEPPFVAVRGSPTRSNLNVRSALNVKGINNLIKEIKTSMGSVFSSENLRPENRIEDYKTALIIQKMVDSRKSGLIMTRDPERNENLFVIDSVFGMGSEPLISEEKDRYVLNRSLDLKKSKIGKKTKALVRDSSGENKFLELHSEIAEKDVLSGYELKRLSQMGAMVEDILGGPQVIDFGIEKEEFYLFGAKSLLIPVAKDVDDIEEKMEVRQEVQEVKDAEIEQDIGNIDSTKSFVKIEEIGYFNGKSPVSYLKDNKIGDFVSLLYKNLRARSLPYDNFRIKLSDFFRESQTSNEVKNPMMGDRGIRFLLRNVDLLEAELSAVKDLADEFPNKTFRVFAPHVISSEEVKKFKKIVDEVSLPSNVKIGVMVETPAAVQVVDDICKEKIDEVSIGLENLTRHTLVVDSDNEDSKEYYDEAHPAVIRSISHVADVCKEQGVKMSILEAEEDFDSPIKTVDESKVQIFSEEELILRALDEDKETDSEYNPGFSEDKDEVPSLNEAIPVDSDLFEEKNEQEEMHIEVPRKEEQTVEESVEEVSDSNYTEPSIIKEDPSHESLLDEWDRNEEDKPSELEEEETALEEIREDGELKEWDDDMEYASNREKHKHKSKKNIAEDEVLDIF